MIVIGLFVMNKNLSFSFITQYPKLNTDRRLYIIS